MNTSPEQQFQPVPCRHEQYECLRCANTGCAVDGCPEQGFTVGLCRSCGHFEKRPLSP